MTQTAHGLTSPALKISGPRATNTLRQDAPRAQAHPALAAAAGAAAAGEHAAGDLPAWDHAAGGRGGLVASADGEHLSAVWRTSSYLESIQWELDAAHESLRQAIQQAAFSGVDHAALQQAANMTSEELEAALLDAPSA